MNNDYKRCDYVIEATHEEAFGCWKQFIKHTMFLGVMARVLPERFRQKTCLN